MEETSGQKKSSNGRNTSIGTNEMEPGGNEDAATLHFKDILARDLEELRERFLFVIELWAADKYRYAWLEKRTGIPAARWQNVLLEKQLPTLEMLIVICDALPQYVFWLMQGTRNFKGMENGLLKLDAPSQESFDEFKAHRKWIKQKRKKKI